MSSFRISTTFGSCWLMAVMVASRSSGQTARAPAVPVEQCAAVGREAQVHGVAFVHGGQAVALELERCARRRRSSRCALSPRSSTRSTRAGMPASRDAQVAGPHAERRLRARAASSRRTAAAAPSTATRAALPGAGQQVHRRRADEAGDVDGPRRAKTSRGVPTCTMRPSMNTAMRSASVIASSWSCVT